jgi:hypothetical protein
MRGKPSWQLLPPSYCQPSLSFPPVNLVCSNVQVDYRQETPMAIVVTNFFQTLVRIFSATFVFIGGFPYCRVNGFGNNSDMNIPQIAKELRAITQKLQELAGSLESAINVDDVEFPRAKMHSVKRRVCLNCEEPIPDGTRPVRGCHYKCYRKLIRSIRDGLITEAEVVKAGKMLPPDPGGRPVTENGVRQKLVDGIRAELRRIEEKELDDQKP